MRKIFIPLFFVASLFNFISCNDEEEVFSASENPFDSTSESSNTERNKIVVISDLHLGNDLSYSENIKHLARLEQFLKEIRTSSTVKELVMAGDILDEWYVPTRINTYGEGTQADFVHKSVTSNQAVFEVLRGIINDGKTKVTYIPGNHDMGFTPENVELALPGVNQARDAGDKYGVGKYSPDGYPEIAIEHGHRYDFFCAITPNANELEAPGATLPPGYFFARIAANSFTDPTTKEEATKVPPLVLNDTENAEQYSKYIYYTMWKTVMENVIYVKDNFSDPIIKTGVGGYTKTYAIDDILPQNAKEDGHIKMNLYDDLFTQSAWDEREKYNNVEVMTNINKAIVGSLKTEFIDDQANVQYFKNPLSKVRVVVFGHTHEPMIVPCTNLSNEPCIYANSGTWEDLKTRNKSANIDQDTMKMNFVVIAPIRASNKKNLWVGMYQYRKGEHVLVDSSKIGL